MRYIKILQFLNFIGFLGVIAINFLANSLPINAQTTGEVSNKYATMFTPADFTFSIWVLIYVGLAVFIIFQSRGFFKNKMNQSRIVVSQLGLVFFINCVANALWIYAWHYEELLLTVILMAVLLLTLIDLNRRINRIQAHVKSPMQVKLAVIFPMGLYLGWICVATIANISAYLNSIHWDGLGLVNELWMILAIITAGLIGIYLLTKYHLISSALAIAWGLTGVVVNNWGIEKNFITNIVAIVIITFLLIGIFYFLIPEKQQGVLGFKKS